MTRTYDVILADPPWRYDCTPTKNRRVENHYPTMRNADICALPVAALAHNASVLLLWATAPKLAECLTVLDAWGFAYVTSAVWDKGKIGMGFWFRGQHELLLIGKRPKARPTPVAARVSSVFRERRAEHSRKPTCVYEWIERAWPSATKLELFARRPRAGWHVWGNEVEADVSMAVA
jgi:N6-adenosine-specific RNA methylase IME4